MPKQILQVEVEKDIYEVSKLAADIIVALKAKKPITEIAAQELPALMAAVDGITNIAGDYKSDPAGSLKGALIPLSDALASLVAPAPSA